MRHPHAPATHRVDLLAVHQALQAVLRSTRQAPAEPEQLGAALARVDALMTLTREAGSPEVPWQWLRQRTLAELADARGALEQRLLRRH